MHIFIFANEADYSIKLVEKELSKRSVLYSRYRFKDITIRENSIYVGGKRFSPENTDRILMRSPFNTPYFTRDYGSLARYIVESYPENVVFDSVAYLRYLPYYQDKLYQAFLYKSLGVPTLGIWYFSNKQKVEWDSFTYPIVLKKRISARSRGNFLIESREDLEKRYKKIKIHNYLLQEYVKAVSDIRINVLNGTVLYAMERMTHMRENNRLTVKGAVPIEQPPEELINYALKVTKAIGADFAGVDFLKDKDGKYYLIESNLSPQFNRAEDIMPARTAILVVDAILKSSANLKFIQISKP